MTHKDRQEQRRIDLKASWARMAEVYPTVNHPQTKLSGPWVEVFLEGWAKIGFKAGSMGHYWRRRPEDRVLSLCGIFKPLQYTIRGQVMIFEVGTFPKCSKCQRKRQRP